MMSGLFSSCLPPYLLCSGRDSAKMADPLLLLSLWRSGLMARFVFDVLVLELAVPLPCFSFSLLWYFVAPFMDAFE